MKKSMLAARPLEVKLHSLHILANIVWLVAFARAQLSLITRLDAALNVVLPGLTLLLFLVGTLVALAKARKRLHVLYFAHAVLLVMSWGYAASGFTILPIAGSTGVATSNDVALIIALSFLDVLLGYWNRN